MTIKETQQQIIEEFSVFQDWMDKYEYLIELGKTLPVISENAKSENNLIKGCQSRVWLNAEYSGGKLYFTADSDAIITKGIISLLVRIFSDKTPDEILNSNLDFLNDIGLNDNLSPTRANGLLSMVKQIKYYAAVYSQTK
ncbi:SufE family protein [Bacteroidota bacterium]